MRVVGRFEIVERIVSGASETYSARDPKSAQTVLLHLLEAGGSGSPEDRFRAYAPDSPGAVLESGTDHAHAEAETIAFLEHWVPAGKSPMCGNSICQDRRFLYRQMPALERFFHYRNLDVSTLKELARRWAPAIAKGFSKDSAHTALSDIHDSIDELRYYRAHMGELGGVV